MTIVHYINEFESLNNKIPQLDMVLLTGIIACKYLNNANIPSERKQIIRVNIV